MKTLLFISSSLIFISCNKEYNCRIIIQYPNESAKIVNQKIESKSKQEALAKCNEKNGPYHTATLE